MSKTDVTTAYSLFIDTLLQIIEQTGAMFGKRRVDRRRRCISRKLGKVRRALLSTTSVYKANTLHKSQQLHEKELRNIYDLQGWEEERLWWV